MCNITNFVWMKIDFVNKFIKRETTALVFSCKFWEISNNASFAV